MSHDIVERLRNYARDYTSTTIDDDLINEGADEIESLLARVFALETKLFANGYEHQICDLKGALAECQKERDALTKIIAKGVDSELVAAERRIRYQDLSTAQARIAELVEALQNYARKDPILDRTDNMEALDAFRDRVIEEVALSVGEHTDVHVSMQKLIRALKKGK